MQEAGATNARSLELLMHLSFLLIATRPTNARGLRLLLHEALNVQPARFSLSLLLLLLRISLDIGLPVGRRFVGQKRFSSRDFLCCGSLNQVHVRLCVFCEREKDRERERARARAGARARAKEKTRERERESARARGRTRVKQKHPTFLLAWSTASRKASISWMADISIYMSALLAQLAYW